jgi:hypothetical protein
MALNRDQLIKLLNLTGSEYDAEALNAIRRANALLRQHRATWTDLLALPGRAYKSAAAEASRDARANLRRCDGRVDLGVLAALGRSPAHGLV